MKLPLLLKLAVICSGSPINRRNEETLTISITTEEPISVNTQSPGKVPDPIDNFGAVDYAGFPDHAQDPYHPVVQQNAPTVTVFESISIPSGPESGPSPAPDVANKSPAEDPLLADYAGIS